MYRCECGRLIWPWQTTSYDTDLGKLIHATCGDALEDSD